MEVVQVVRVLLKKITKAVGVNTQTEKKEQKEKTGTPVISGKTTTAPLEEIKIFRWHPKSLKEIRPLMKGTSVTANNPDNATWFVAITGSGRKVGCFCCVIKDGQARFKSFVVVKEYRGFGVGRKLWNAQWNWTCKQNLKKITAFSSKMSRPLFIKAGFSVVRVIPRGERGDTWYMVLQLKNGK